MSPASGRCVHGSRVHQRQSGASSARVTTATSHLAPSLIQKTLSQWSIGLYVVFFNFDIDIRKIGTLSAQILIDRWV